MIQGVYKGKTLKKKKRKIDTLMNTMDEKGHIKWKKTETKSLSKQPLGKVSEEEERRLERRVLGGASEVLEQLDMTIWDTDDKSQMVALDSGVDEEYFSPESSGPFSDTLGSPKLLPVWQDDEDSDIRVKDALTCQGRHITYPGTSSDRYTNLLKTKFENIIGAPRWAELNRKTRTDDDSDEELLQHCGKFLGKKASALHKGTLETKRVRDLNRETYTEGPIIKAVQFHPSATVSLVAGLSGVASLFQVDGRSNSKLQSIQFERFPISCAHFTPDGEQFLVGSQHHSHYYRYDLLGGKSVKVAASHGLEITNMKMFEMSPDGRLLAACGRFGNIYLLTARTNECVGTLKMNGEVTTVAFNLDGSRLFSHGDSGEVYIWDMSSRMCLHKFVDDGCILGSSLAASPSGQFLATGSNSGVVNVYETASLTSNSTPQPIKILFNLTTPITSLKFNMSSEILGMASSDKENAIKLVHFPSMTVFENFPSFQAKVRRPLCLEFSRNSGFMAVGNNKNTALLYRLKHYGNY